MNILKSIFARIWAIWGLITFIVTFIIILPISMLAYLYKDEVEGQRYFIAVSKVWMRFWLFLVGCPLKISGLQNFSPGENYVVTFNHNAFLDVPLSAPFIPGGNKTIAKDSFAKIPIFNWFYKRGAVLVNRKSEASRVRSFELMKEVLRKGMHMCIYPEGTRNRTGKPLKDFYDGAFKLAIDAKKEILPCIITGTTKAMPIKQTFYLLPTKLNMYFLPPVSSIDKTAHDLKTEVYNLMLQEFLSKK